MYIVGNLTTFDNILLRLTEEWYLACTHYLSCLDSNFGICSIGVGEGSSENHGCFKASAALILVLGSIFNIFDSRSKPLSFSDGPPEKEVRGNRSLNLLLDGTRQDTFDTFGNFEKPGHFSSVGRPKTLNILVIWSVSPSPGKMG